MTSTVRLHDYQNDMKLRLAEAWQHHRSVMVQMPTGTGKTVVLAALVSEELLCGPSGKDKVGRRGASVVIVVHRRELVAQIEETLSRFGIDMEDGRVRVMSIQWLSRHWEDVTDVPQLVIIDEAHHAVAETYRMLWDRFSEARFLGLTATPCRMNHRGFADLFDTLICSWSIAEFIERGRLSAFDYVSIRRGSEEQRLIDSLEKRGADGDYQIKEMNNVLNRSTSIARLYASMEQFAAGKKGIVYAISIDHARRIADYYSCHGVSAMPIDSKTPAAERRRMVDDFKAGRLKVLVNVDIFSEGFDCPDVEFVQMARPTLSLAKYLQQVGRGLRKTDGKETCVLIDNVGLYRVFGLPTVAWDWEAMFRGERAGKGRLLTEVAGNGVMLSGQKLEETVGDCDMEVIVAHDQLLSGIGMMKDVLSEQMNGCGLKAWLDEDSGLWGLKCGRRKIAEAQFVSIFDIRCGMAAVRFLNMDCGIVDDKGDVVWKKDGCRAIRFLRNKLLYVEEYNKVCYVDMESLRVYKRRPKVLRYGNIELLEIDRTYYSRTKKVYVNNQGIDKQLIVWRGFYLAIYDMKVPCFGVHDDNMFPDYHSGFACILEDDSDSCYWVFRRLADGSIIIMDNDKKYFHAAEKKPKSYIGCGGSEEE